MSDANKWFAQCGGVSGFLRHYWQQKPLLIRNAVADVHSLISADELAGLSLEEEVESRLVSGGKTPGDWHLRHGPFDESAFKQLEPGYWTLLVQAVDQWQPNVRQLLEYFDFLPGWRLDDIMVSYAVDQGGVGPHFDQYDVFLLQGEGQRRWKTGQVCDASTPLLEGIELKILRDFESDGDWLLNPGDMLYLPPGLAHWGIAVGECITYSVGFRAPDGIEMLNDLATELLITDKPLLSPMYRDPQLPLSNTEFSRDVIDKAFIDSAKSLLLAQLDNEQLLGEWLARYMTTRKYPDLDLINESNKLIAGATLDKHALIARHPASRFAALPMSSKKQWQLAVDGCLYPCSAGFAQFLAGSKTFNVVELASFTDEDRGVFVELLESGSLLIDRSS